MKQLPKILVFFILLGTAGWSSAQNFGQINIQAPEATGMQINAITGELIYQRQDLFIPDIGFDLDLSFTYNSAEGWRYSFEWSAEMNESKSTSECIECPIPVFAVSGGASEKSAGGGAFRNLCKRELKIVKSDGGAIYFTMPDELQLFNCRRIPNYNVKTPARIASQGAVLESTSGSLTYTTRFGMKYSFASPQSRNDPNEPKGQILSMEDRNGNRLIYEYENGVLKKLIAPSGRYLEFSWQEYALSGRKANRLIKAIDPNGETPRAFNYEYDELARLTKATNPMGGETIYVYAGGNLNRVIDENGNETLISYTGLSSQPQVSSLTTCLSKMTLSYTSSATYLKEYKNDDEYIETTYRHDREVIKSMTGNCCGYNMEYDFHPLTKDMTSYTDANGHITSFEYDTLSNLTKITDPLGCTIEMEYEAEFSQMTSYKDKKGNITAYDYDEKGNLRSVNRPLSVVESMAYNSVGQMTASTDGRGNTTTYDYNTNGDLVQINHPLTHVTQMTYDGRSNQLTETDANNHTATYEYDELNRLTRTIDARNGSTSIQYDARRNITQITNPKNQITSFEYDQLDRMTAIKAPLNLNYHFAYDGLGNLTETKNPRGGTVFNTYNNLNLIESVTDQLGFQTFFTYDGAGNRTSITDPNGNTAFYEYDPLNRLERITDPLGYQTQYAYDCNDNLTMITDANNNAASIAYDNLDRVVSHTDAMNALSQFEYDKNDNLSKIIDANSNETAYTYDERNRNTLMTFADNTTKIYVYDGVGNIVSRTDNNGNTTQYTYDELDRLVLRDYPDANDDTFQYDPLGNMVFAQNQNATVEFTYDDANRLTAETLNGKSTRYAYNAPNGKMTLIYPSGKVVEENYDRRGQLITIRENNRFLAGFQYDGAGRLISRTYANNTASLYTYNANNWLSSITHNPNAFIQLLYAYDNVGNILSQEFAHRPDHSEAYAYDLNYRLVNYKKGTLSNGDIAAPTKEIAYNYDDLGNRTSVVEDGMTTTYVSNEMNEYASLSGAQNVSFTYDDNGNLLTDGNAAYEYDHMDRLVKISDNGNAIDLVYDPFSRRIQELTSLESLNFYYAGFRSIEERNLEDEVERNLFYGTWIDDLVSIALNDLDYFMHANQIGSVSGITDQEGAINERYEYDPFGKIDYYDNNFLFIPQSRISKNFFTGRYKYSNSNLQSNRLRHYSNSIGRFIHRDPIMYVDGMNLYEYVKSNPELLRDPLGLISPADRQRCKNLRKKIRNKEDQIKKRLRELKEDKYNLPETCPGDFKKPRLSKKGHRRIINELKRDLAVDKKNYEIECHDDDNDPTPDPITQPAPQKKPESVSSGDSAWEIISYSLAGVGAGYLIYRGVRIIPSFAPPLWWTLPANFATP